MAQQVELTRVDLADVILVSSEGWFLFGGIETLTFVASDVSSSADVLAALIEHVDYAHSYASPRDGERGEIHGPYWLNAIHPATFDQVSPAEASEAVERWIASSYPDHSVENRKQVSGLLPATFRPTDKVFQLRDLRASAEHDWGWVVGFNGFIELVSIGADGRVVLLVATDD